MSLNTAAERVKAATARLLGLQNAIEQASVKPGRGAYNRADNQHLQSLSLDTPHTFVAQMQGARDEQQDAYQVGRITDLDLSALTDLDKADAFVEAVLLRAFENLQANLDQNLTRESGSTAVVCLRVKLPHGDYIYTASLGDSAAHLVRKKTIAQLSIPHSPNPRINPDEYNRVQNSVQRVGNIPRLQGRLALTRAFGDRPYEPELLHTPDITRHLVQAGDHLSLTCDGVTDYLKPSDISGHVSNSEHDPERSAAALRDAVAKAGAHDNTTIVCAKLTEIPKDTVDVYAVFDGHGTCGATISQQLAANIIPAVTARLQERNIDTIIKRVLAGGDPQAVGSDINLILSLLPESDFQNHLNKLNEFDVKEGIARRILLSIRQAINTRGSDGVISEISKDESEVITQTLTLLSLLLSKNPPEPSQILAYTQLSCKFKQQDIGRIISGAMMVLAGLALITLVTLAVLDLFTTGGLITFASGPFLGPITLKLLSILGWYSAGATCTASGVYFAYNGMEHTPVSSAMEELVTAIQKNIK